MQRTLLALIVAAGCGGLFAVAQAAEPLPTIPPIARKVPPPGIKLTADQHKQLADALAALDRRIGKLDDPDVLIYEKAVRFALLDDEFYRSSDVKTALSLIADANHRLDDLAAGKKPWTTARGVIVRGYTSDIDGSAQPYGLEIPEHLDLSKPVPLYVWLHGRGDKTTDLPFIASAGHRSMCPFSKLLTDGIIVHPFGRQCIGYKSAGEIDVFDVIDSVSKRYKIDPDRIALMGFSMGGAGAWHLGAHYADHFCIVHAGAGFVDVQRYQHVDPATVSPVERALWGVYDVPDYVRNLFNVPVIAYSGEIDHQKASADIMEQTFKDEGRQLHRVIGPKMGHRYDPGSLKTIAAVIEAAVKKGRDPHPKVVHLQTRWLRYDRMFWARVVQLTHQWQDTRIDAKIVDAQHCVVNTKNVQGFSLSAHGMGMDQFPPGYVIEWNGVSYRVPTAREDLVMPDWPMLKDAADAYQKNGRKMPDELFRLLGDVPKQRADGLVKQHGLQGPIDDAFMAPFLVVTPTGQSGDARFDQWVTFELEHLKNRWRALFRGDIRMKKDTDVTADDIAKYHLVCFGDAKSNHVIARLADKLPMPVREGDHVDLMIYPNPLNPEKYVVLNSGPTFREAHDRTNSLQNPKLGDWAVIDITTPPNAETPGKILRDGFFDNNWQLPKP